jgi:hypothetical protein
MAASAQPLLGGVVLARGTCIAWAVGLATASGFSNLGGTVEPQQRRTPADLIEELNAEATKFQIVLLVVVFQKAATIFIRSDNNDRLSALTAAVAREGEAVGFIGMKDEGESVSFYRRVLTEYAKLEGFSKYLASVTDEVAEILGCEKYKSSPEWVN